jgi:TonB family protein
LVSAYLIFFGISVHKTTSSRTLAPIRRPAKALCFMLVSLFVLSTAVPALHAQTENNARKLIYRVEPEYPADLKRIGIGGYVRVEATISPSGTVEDATIAGGNPVLAEAAVKAVKKWKYAPLDSKTKAKLVFHFAP